MWRQLYQREFDGVISAARRAVEMRQKRARRSRGHVFARLLNSRYINNGTSKPGFQATKCNWGTAIGGAPVAFGRYLAISC
jgi:hypothetical protein